MHMRKLLLTFLMLPSLALAQAINTPPTISSFTQLKGSTGGTITGFGTAIGQALGPLNTVGGLPGFFLPSGGGLIFNMNAAQPTDYSTFRVLRTAVAGGTLANIVRALGVETIQVAGNGSNEWNLVGKCTSSSTVAGLCDAGFFTATRGAGSNAWLKGLIAGVTDSSSAASSVGVNAVNALELDVAANSADDSTNLSWIGGVGVRSGVHLAAIRQDGANTAQTQFGYGIWLSTTDPAGTTTSDPHTNYMTAFGFGKQTQVYSAFDTRGAIVPTGSANPVYGLNMDAGHAIEFKGDDTTLSPAPQRTLLYTASTLAYQVSAVTKFAISDTGGVTATGLPTSAGGGGLNVCVDSVGVLYKKASCP
jgi:hypothetical protein